MQRFFGWKKQQPDFRDYKFRLEKLQPIQSVFLASKYNLGEIFDQLDLGSCTANAMAFLVYFDLLNKHAQKIGKVFRPSRLFIYYFERALEGTIGQDAGAELRSGAKVLATEGVCSEDTWVYDTNKFAIEPPVQAVKQAINYQSLLYQSVDNTNKQLLVNTLLEGYPIAFGVTVYDSFMTNQVAATGIVPMPKTTEGIAGGHAMAIVGYHATYDAFIVRNSWGLFWGDKGYCRIPAAYLTNPDLASDFWIVESIL
jgi:C1A family cysteine protease